MSNSKLLFSPTKIMQSKLYEEGISSLTSVVKKQQQIFSLFIRKIKTENGKLNRDLSTMILHLCVFNYNDMQIINSI